MHIRRVEPRDDFMCPLALAPGVQRQKRVIFYRTANIHMLLRKAAGNIAQRIGVFDTQRGRAVEHQSDAAVGVL